MPSNGATRPSALTRLFSKKKQPLQDARAGSTAAGGGGGSGVPASHSGGQAHAAQAGAWASAVPRTPLLPGSDVARQQQEQGQALEQPGAAPPAWACSTVDAGGRPVSQPWAEPAREPWGGTASPPTSLGAGCGVADEARMCAGLQPAAAPSECGTLSSRATGITEGRFGTRHGSSRGGALMGLLGGSKKKSKQIELDTLR